MAREKVKHGGSSDPDPYDGQIARIDGVKPYNHYLWSLPGDSWCANRGLGGRVHSRWHFEVIALEDGRFSTVGSVYAIERNDYAGRPCVFDSRSKAVRVAAAKTIRLARASRQWEGMCGGLKGETLECVINWALKVVAIETARKKPKHVRIKVPAKARIKTGLPLFDFDLLKTG